MYDCYLCFTPARRPLSAKIVNRKFPSVTATWPTAVVGGESHAILLPVGLWYSLPEKLRNWNDWRRRASEQHACAQAACMCAATCMCAGSMHACSACKHEAAKCMSEHTTESICCAMAQFGSTRVKMKFYNYRILVIVIEMVFYCQYLTVQILKNEILA